MRQQSPDQPDQGFWLTEKGRHDLLTAPTCNCQVRLAGLLIQCPDCETVYGYLKDRTPRPLARFGRKT